MKWLRLRSWHLFKEWSKTEPDVAITHCSRRIMPTADNTWDGDVPDGKTCETCFREVARHKE